MTGSVLAIDMVDRAGRLHQLVLKLYTPEPTEPDSPKREAHILELLRTSDLTVPRVVAIDPDGVECEMPALLMTRLPGRPRIWPRQIERWIQDLAASAARIHATAISPDSLPEYSRYEHEKPKAPSWSKQPEMWDEAIAAFEEPPPDQTKTFIHRDFHAGNVLWSAGAVSGIVDWLHGCWGPAEQDLAHCRLNLWVNQGPAAANALLDAYYRPLPPPVPGGGSGSDHRADPYRRLRAGSLLSGPYHPYWDLDEALGNNGAENAFGNRRRYESFIAAAVSKL
jgi:Ser/Thr protein kinase RdoA (MazF antagonist)